MSIYASDVAGSKAAPVEKWIRRVGDIGPARQMRKSN